MALRKLLKVDIGIYFIARFMQLMSSVSASIINS